jgi:hypothetical protein
MKTLVLATFSVLWMTIAVTAANAGSQPYRTPRYNYYQNNWMSSLLIFQASPAAESA